MADNIAVTPGAGASVATDDVGSVHYQRIKVAHGADGSATDSSDSTPFPVSVAGGDVVLTVTPTLDTAAYASGDLIFDATEIANAVRANGGTARLESVTLLDKADQGVTLTLVFLNAATDMGTLNAAPDPDDTEAETILGHVLISSGDYLDVGASKIACVRNIGLPLKAGAATTSLYVAAINGTSTPTYGSASAMILQLGFSRA